MEVKFGTGKTDFFKSLKVEVADYFREKNIKSTGGMTAMAKAIALVPLLAGIYIWLVAFQPYSWWICMALYVVLGVVIALIGFNMMHDGAHGAFSRHKAVNRIMAYSLNLLGGNALVWNSKHNISHHTYTNIEDVDDDIDLGPFIRLHDQQKRRWFHRYQHIYAMLLYCLSYMIWIYVSDFRKYFSGKVVGEMAMPKLKFREHFVFWFSKLGHVFVFLVFPLIMLGPAKAIAGYFISVAVTGFIIGIVFQLAHIVEEVSFTSGDRTSNMADIKSEWAMHQIGTTVNFAMNNKFLTWCLGGLNFQMIHHLFPKVSHVHYPAIRPIILSVCKQYNLKYVEFPGFFSALRSHLRHLKHTGRA